MVGREREMATLAPSSSARSTSTPAGMATVIAEPASASRAWSAIHHLVAEEATVLRGRCLPYGEGITFWPLVEVAREAAAIEQDDAQDEARSKLAGLTGDEAVDRAPGLGHRPVQ